MTILDHIFPPQCLVCRTRVVRHGTLCMGCWNHIHFITEPYCACCGLPFDFALGAEALCAECISERPPYSRARAAFKYDEHSSKLVTALKYSDQTYLASVYGTWLEKAGGELLAGADIIVPVPLHWKRFISRRYNQSALLAQSLARKARLLLVPDALKRIKPTAPQTGLSRNERQNNVRGAFIINPSRHDALKGKSILLVDDVMTTAATIEQCANTLLKGGVSSVNVLTLARKI